MLETVSYQYTDAGNRSVKTVTGATPYTVTYQYDANNRLTQESNTQRDVTRISDYQHDPNGNLISTLYSQIASGTGKATLSLSAENDGAYSLYTYDGWNRLTGAQTDGNTASYAYNADNLRVSKTVNDTTIGFILENGNVVAETNGSGITAKYVYGLDLIYREANGQKQYYRRNGHGDVTQLADANGTVTKNYTYDAFGVETNPDETDSNPFRYAGEYWDEETNNIYLRNRYYTPRTGRFVTEDTHWNTGNMIYGDEADKETPVPDIAAIMQSGNLYGYCMGNPVKYEDPLGKVITESDKLAHAAGLITNAQFEFMKQQDNAYRIARQNNDYDGMSKAHAFVAAIRKVYDKNYVDNYDYTYGGKVRRPNNYMIAAEVPPESSGYVPPKKGNIWNKERRGWMDRDGNVWVRDKKHNDDHWDVQYPNGGYDNVYRDGKVRAGKGGRGKFSPSTLRDYDRIEFQPYYIFPVPMIPPALVPIG